MWHEWQTGKVRAGFWSEDLGEKDQRHGHSWEDNIKINLREVGWEGMDWIDLAQDKDWWRAVVNAVMNLRVS